MGSPITTHILDTAQGKPASGVKATLSMQQQDGSWKELAGGVTNSDGRIADLLPEGKLDKGTYQMTFEVGEYQQESFYPYVSIVFQIQHPEQHYHIPLLLSPYGYTTYRGS